MMEKKHVEKNMKQMLVEEFEWFWQLKAGHVDGKLVEIIGENGMTRRLQEQFRCRQGGRVDAWMVLLVGREAPKFVGSVRQPSFGSMLYVCVCVYIYICVCMSV
jgi:hypothetical protein